jgi:hypothetical protein
MSKYLMISILLLILLAVACSDSGDKSTQPTPTLPTISVADDTVVEGGTALFTVTLNKVTDHQVILTYATSPGTATAGTDFTTVSGTDTIAVGETSATVLVATIDDSNLESAETFSLTLSSVSGAEVADGLATGTINDNETAIVSYATKVAPLLDLSCALPGFCHGPSSVIAGGLYIDRGATYSTVINATGNVTGGKVVVPGDASSSSLYRVTTSSSSILVRRMPIVTMGYDTLTTAKQNLLRDWINQGALDN